MGEFSALKQSPEQPCAGQLSLCRGFNLDQIAFRDWESSAASGAAAGSLEK